MSEAVTYLLGICATAVIFAFIMLRLNDKHGFLKYLLVFGLLILGLFIPGAMLNSRTQCEVVMANSTIVNSSLTSYDYQSFCFTTDTSLPVTYYQVMSYAYYVIIGYLMLWSIINAFNVLLQSMGGKKL